MNVPNHYIVKKKLPHYIEEEFFTNKKQAIGYAKQWFHNAVVSCSVSVLKITTTEVLKKEKVI